MRADVLIFAAGLGSRLRPLTDNIPKPLIEVGGKTLLDRNLELVAKAGFKKVIINSHYKRDLIKKHLEKSDNFGLSVKLVEEEVLLNTGGTIKNIESFLEHQNLITINSDIILGSDFSLNVLLAAHEKNATQPLATLVLREDPASKTYGEVCIDQNRRVCRFLEVSYFESLVAKCMMYTGVQVLSRRALSLMPKVGSIFSITQDFYSEQLSKGEKIFSYEYAGHWSDVGTTARLSQAKLDLEQGRF